jgi:hypothetical protein
MGVFNAERFVVQIVIHNAAGQLLYIEKPMNLHCGVL